MDCLRGFYSQRFLYLHILIKLIALLWVGRWHLHYFRYLENLGDIFGFFSIGWFPVYEHQLRVSPSKKDLLHRNIPPKGWKFDQNWQHPMPREQLCDWGSCFLQPSRSSQLDGYHARIHESLPAKWNKVQLSAANQPQPTRLPNLDFNRQHRPPASNPLYQHLREQQTDHILSKIQSEHPQIMIQHKLISVKLIIDSPCSREIKHKVRWGPLGCLSHAFSESVRPCSQTALLHLSCQFLACLCRTAWLNSLSCTLFLKDVGLLGCELALLPYILAPWIHWL